MAPRGPASRDFAVVTRDLAFQLRKDGRRKSSETPISMSRAHPLLLVLLVLLVPASLLSSLAWINLICPINSPRTPHDCGGSL